MISQSQRTVRVLDVFGRGITSNFEHLVMIALHDASPE